MANHQKSFFGETIPHFNLSSVGQSQGNVSGSQEQAGELRGADTLRGKKAEAVLHHWIKKVGFVS